MPQSPSDSERGGLLGHPILPVFLAKSWLTITPPTPLFFVSVASKGLSPGVSLLFATLAREFVSVAAKRVTGVDCWRESNCVGWKDSGDVRRTTWPIEALGKRASMDRGAPSFPAGPESAIPTRSGSTIARAAAGRRRKLAD